LIVENGFSEKVFHTGEGFKVQGIGSFGFKGYLCF